MIKYINAEDSFQVPASRFCIGATTDGYTLQISADGVGFTDAPNGEVEAGVNKVVINGCPGMYYYLESNTDTAVPVSW